MRGQLDTESGNFVPYCDPAVLPTFLAEINETVAWLYDGAGEQASLEEYEQKMYKLKDVGEKIKARCRFHETLPSTQKTYDALMKKVENKLATNEDMKVDLRERIINMTTATSEFWEKFQAGTTSAQKWDDPGYTLMMADAMFATLANQLK
jgi:hypothetical protein